MGIHSVFLAFSARLRCLIEIPRQLLSRGKLSVCTALSFSKCTQFKITWHEVRGITEIISYRGISPFHKYFPRFPSSHLPCPKETQRRKNNKSGRFLLRLLEFAAPQHLCPTLFLFLITFAPDRLL